MGLLKALTLVGLLVLAAPVFAQNTEFAPATPATPVHMPFLVYHSVFPDHPGQTDEQRKYGVTPEQLDEQLTYLEEKGYTTLSMQDAVRAVRTATTTEKLVAITFDDGWWNQYAYALPILIKHHMVATFFIYPKPIGTSGVYMDWEQVKGLLDAGMSIGSHSYTHSDFGALTPEQLHIEVLASKWLIEAHTRQPVSYFASPYGYYSPELENELRDAGYLGNRTLGGVAHSSARTLYDLKGFVVTRDMERFKQIIDGAP